MGDVIPELVVLGSFLRRQAEQPRGVIQSAAPVHLLCVSSYLQVLALL